ncbi:uncharacterized protein LOC131294779 [Anopheles ziemanni]|uniref:uncharacterized protein LOC131265358 n=1 Tax=Anopheles coustani TaxID=139045 RepID=UPI002659DCEB|nr:uncharacterized protein LOC131265358 [Anopheles coustani]XP_058178806.1 uncharacterized protein LOC131294779 [Anopheles ziemanni]
MEPSPASAVPAESATVTETPSGDGKPTQEEVNSTQLTAPASPVPPPTQQCTTTTTSGSPRIPEEAPTPNEPSMATPADSAVGTEDESTKEPTESVQPEKPADVIDPLPGNSGQSPPEITTTTQETETPTEKESAGVGVIDQGQSEAMETTSSYLVPNDGEVKQDEPVLESPRASTDQVNAKEAGSSSCEMSSESVPTSSSNDSEVPPSGPPPPPPPATTPPPEVESSTASPEKRTEEHVDYVEPPVDAGSSAVCAVDSSSGSSPPRDLTTDLNRGSGTDGSDNVNSISTSGSCEPEESHQARTVGSGRDANDDPPGDPQPNIGSSTSAVEPAVDTAAVIEDKPPPAVAGAGAVELSEGAPDQKEVNGKHEPEPSTSSEIMKTVESEKKPEARTSRSSSVHDRLSDAEDNPRQQQTNEENASVGSSTNGNTHTLNEKLQQDTEPSQSRESSTVPPEPDPGPSSSGREEPRSSTGGERASIESSTTSKSDKDTSDPSKDEGNVSGVDGKAVGGGGVVNSGRVSDYQSPSGQPTARNPLQFTEVANDEVELKVDGGHLLDRVIKLSLLKGLQDGGKRLAKSSLIISGACEGSNGEATLATTSSLSKAKNAAGLRLVEESKTTPPALVAPPAAAAAVVPLVNGTVDTVSVRELASSTREDHQRGPPVPRVRHSSETVSSGSGELEDTRGTWHGGNSALDFREEAVGRASQNDEPQNSAVEQSTTSHDGYRRPHSRELVASSEHLPVKARKPQYYASIPDFSKQSKFSPSPPGNSSGGAVATSTSTAASSTSSSPAAKSLTQLHMKTPDFSRLGVVSSTATATSSTSMPAAASTTVTTNSPSNAGVRTTSELKISNPDFSKGFAFGHPGSGAGYPGSPGQQSLPPPPAGSPYVSPDTFSKLIKERNYIADLQLKNPPPSNGAEPHSEGLKRSVVVDTTTHSGSVPKASPYEPVAESSYHHHHHRGQPLDNAMDLEPQAHVIHKKSARPQPPPSGGVPKTWNPPEFSSTHFTQPQGSNRPPVSSNGSVTGGPSSSSSSSSPAPRDPSPAPSSSSASPHPGSYGAQPYPPYGGKPSHPLPPSTERIIVNNVRTYYPEQAALPTGTVPVPVGGGSSSKQTVAPPQPHYHHPGLPKVKDPEFRLDHNKEQQLLQEGTIITVKQPSYPNHIAGRPQQQPTHPAAARSPSAERREAQMLQNSQEILYRDYRQHKRPSVGGGGGGSGRPTSGPLQGTPTSQGPPPPHPPANDRRSPYDAYYHPMMHHQRGPVHPQAAGSGLMHPPPPNWPGAGPTPPPPHPTPSQQRGGGVVARSSPHDNGTSPVSSPAPLPPGGSIPSPTHHYYTHPQHHHPQQHGGQYKNSPSPVSGSAYGSAASPTQPMAAAGKYPPPAQQPYGRSEAERDPYTKGQTPGIYKAGLDYNMEQKFAEVYQAHQEKEKQAAEAATTPGRQPSRNAPRTGGSPGGVSSASSSAAAGGGPSKPVYGAYDPYGAYYHHSQATPSPTSTPSPVPSPHHRKYSGPPSRDPSPLGQQGAPSQQPLHHRSNESLYHLTPGPASVYMHSGPPRDPAANGSHDPRGGAVQQQQTAGIPYHANQPSSSSTYPMPTPYATGVAIPPSASNPPQHSVINAASYDRHYQPASHPSYGGSSSSQSSQGTPHHGKSLPYPPGRQPQHQQPLQPPPPQPQAGPVPASANGGVSVPSSAPSSSYSYPHHPPMVAAATSESAVIHPPVGSKNIPVRVIATAPPASKVAGSGQQHTLSNSARPTGGVGASSSMASSQGVVRGVAGGATGGGGDERGVTADGVGTVTAVIIAPAKRESPLDLSVKTVKTKADSTGCDDYGNVSASNSSISSSSSSSSSSTSSSGGSAALLATRPRGGEVVPKVDFNPNFNKHIPPSPHSSGRGSTPGGGPPPVASGGRPSDPLPGPPPPRHVSVISPAIPPGYDKTTDAYMSAKYRAVGGPLVTPVLHYSPHYPLPPHGAPAGYDPAAPPGNSSKSQADPYSSPKQQPGSGQPGPASGSGSASSKSVYYPPAAAAPGPTHPGMSNAPHQPTMDYMRGGKPLGGSIITGQALPSGSRAPALPPPPPSASANQHQGAVAPPPPSRPDDARSEDRKFVENMLKKKTSPSSDVIADLQSGRFPTRLPQSLVPKKRAAAAAAAAAAAEAAQSKAASGGSPNVPSPAKVGKYEEREQPGHEAATPGYHPQNAPKDGLYHAGPAKPYGTGENLPQLGGGSKRTETAVHPSVITTNYHHQQQQQHHHQQHQQQQQYPPDMRYYPHQQPVGPSKPREDPVAPVYHQPHLRGGSSLPYGHAYHPQYHHSEHPQHLGAYPQHKDPSGQPMFRYSEPPKSSPESTSVQHMQSHIHYTGSAGVPGGKEYQHQHQQQQHPPPPHHLQQQSLPSSHGKSGGIEVARSPYVPPPHSSPYGGGVPPPPPQVPVPVPSSQQHPQHHRGADQAVISKLRTSLELKEFKEKQRISQLRKLPSGDPVEEPPVHSNPPTTPVTPDAPSSSARFRTKGELKGYTPLPLPPSVPDPSKREGDAPKDHEGGVSGGGKTEMDGTDAPLGDGAGAATPLLDIVDWGSACNEFVEQLQTGKKRGRRKRSSTTTPVGGRGWHGLGQDGGELMAATVGDGSSADLSAVPKDVLNSARSPPKQHRLDRSGSVSSSDEDKPLLLLRQQSQQQQQQHRDEDEPDPRQQPQHMKLTDKLARNMREKQRLELEQKHEAKLGRSSSTDSDTARLASAAAQRAKARVRKLRHRSSIVSSSVLKSSDGDGDVTADEDETIKAGGGKRPLLHSSLANSSNAAKRKRLERRSSSASSSESEQPEVEPPEVVRRKRGRPKGSLGGAKRAQQQQQQQQQQATMTRCQTSTLKQDPNENSDLSSEDDKTSKALRTPPVKGERNASSHRADSTKKGGGSGSGGSAGNGGTSGGGSKSGGQQVKVDNSTTGEGKAKKKSTDNHDNGTPRKSEEPANGNGSSSKKPPAKPRTTSRSKTPVVQGQGVNSSGGSSSSSSSSSSASSSSSSSSSSSEAEDRETMTRSKSKREAERRRSNSKVLRNDKIVENLSATVNHRRARIENERTPTKQKQTKNSRETPASSAGKRSKPAESDSDRSAATTTTPAAVSAEKVTGVPRKRTRQASKNGPSSSVESDQGSSSDDEGTAAAPGATDLNERLRKRRSKNGSEQAGGKVPSKGSASVGKGSRSRRESTATKSGREEPSAKKKQPTASGAASAGSSSSGGGGGRGGSRKGSVKDGGASTGPADHFYPGWEKELYEYKRSLKVPPELITIGGGLYMHRISTSLPDLDSPHHSDGSETFSEIVKKLNQKEEAGGPPNVSTPPAPKRIKTKAAAKQQQPPTAQACGQAVKVKEERPESLQEQRKKKLDGNEKFSSIIELLHRRCLAAALLQQGKAGTGGTTAAAGTGKQKAKGASAKANVNNNNNNNNNEITVKPKQEYELLPTPGAESESLFAKNCKKKKSLFDTAILKSRTRTEQKAMQSKEMIREVFGADEERPQSAPPLGCGGLFEEGIHNVTYDEKYNELMRNVDRIVGELDGSSGGVAVSVKQELDEEQEEEDGAEDDEDDERMRVEGDDETQDSSVLMKDSERDTPSVASERDLLGGTPLSFKGLAVASTPGPPGATVVASTSTGVVGNAMPEKKRRGRGHRTSRRKGSSGFDYIRKKKKPSQQHHNNQANGSNHHRGGFGASSSNINGIYGGIHGESRKKPMSAFERLEVKDETHINKEIRSWVLNKGVGESVMHKAARLGYTDVIVYCLERLDMDPDLKDNAGYTPLHEACAKGHLDIANYLLQYGASHSEPAPSGMRPLHEAVENSFIEIVRLLLSFGADPMLTTYNGSTPEQLAESDSMIRFLQDHLNDVQSMGPTKTAWKFDGPWKMHDAEESGYNVFSHIPDFDGEDSGISSLNTSAGSTSTGTSASGTTSCSSGERRCDSNSNIMTFEEVNSKPPLENGIPADATIDGGGSSVPESPVAVGGSVGLRNGKVMKRDPQKDANTLVNGFLKGENRTKLPNGVAARSGEEKCKPADGLEDAQLHDDDNENDGMDGSDGMVFEYEESDRPLPPLYALKDEHNERWVLLSDLCPLLKFKSKEAVLRQICPNNSVINQRDLIREMKFEEFLTRAHCLQLLCAGEKLNIHASKVVLVKYNDSVKSLLQVKSMMTRI